MSPRAGTRRRLRRHAQPAAPRYGAGLRTLSIATVVVMAVALALVFF